MNRRELITTGVALFSLVLGLLIYVLVRDSADLAWLPATSSPAAAFADWSGPLPSFLHTLGFILLTAVVAGARRRASLAFVSLAWVGVESMFEIGQHPLLADDLAAGLSGLPGLGSAGHYFVNGTFDPLDLLAVALAGALALTLTLGGDPRHKENHHV